VTRIEDRLSLRAGRKEKALACFVTSGFPNQKSTVPLVLEIADQGADIIELGMPFSDPLADGPVIQHASHTALQQGATLGKVLAHAKSIRRASDVPLVLMGYLNPIMKFGAEKFFEEAASAGVDGLILPELPYEETDRYRELFDRTGLANILLVTPTTPSERIASIDRASEGFLYCVSSTGVTGSAGQKIAKQYIRRVKQTARKNRVLVGFGIATPDDARSAAEYADGVVIGSALLRKCANGESLKNIGRWVRTIRKALVAER
jgi:tryptophan synthase alpha chain